jgi:hypothetical protein
MSNVESALRGCGALLAGWQTIQIYWLATIKDKDLNKQDVGYGCFPETFPRHSALNNTPLIRRTVVQRADLRETAAG